VWLGGGGYLPFGHKGKGIFTGFDRRGIPEEWSLGAGDTSDLAEAGLSPSTASGNAIDV
jgi:hypothetical protein